MGYRQKSTRGTGKRWAKTGLPFLSEGVAGGLGQDSNWAVYEREVPLLQTALTWDDGLVEEQGCRWPKIHEHHEMDALVEVSQQRCCLGHPFLHHWRERDKKMEIHKIVRKRPTKRELLWSLLNRWRSQWN